MSSVTVCALCKKELKDARRIELGNDKYLCCDIYSDCPEKAYGRKRYHIEQIRRDT